MTLTLMSLLLGIALAIPSIYGLLQPEAFQKTARAFPRSNSWGYALMGISTVWFLYLVKMEDISDFAAYKTFMLAGFAAIGIGSAVYVRDFLAVRGAAVLALLVAKVMVETARWVDTPWRLVIVLWAYAWVIAGMWWTISPWRFRNLIHWAVADIKRIRILSITKLMFSIFIILLALTVYRTAPQP
ncbi:MAG: hypothetical protein P8L18_09820 [Verrucomicrobiota bacterium]|nr:hypothetical protein [Verrucomicrobiota bacterium]